MNLCLKKSPINLRRVPKRLASGLRGVKQKAKEQIVPFHAPFARHFSILEVRRMIISSGPKGKEAKQGQLLGPAAKEEPRELRGLNGFWGRIQVIDQAGLPGILRPSG
jgi:hypothetical protein